MTIVLGIYAAFIWLIFFQFKILPWNRLTKILVSLFGLAILLTFIGLLNSLTPSGRVTVMSPVVEVASVVNGTVAEIPVKTHQVVKDGDVLLKLDKRPFEFAVQQAQASSKIAEVTYLRIKTAVEKNPGTFSRQKVDETQAIYQAASAALEIAKYNLDRAEIVAIGDGILGSVQLRVGDRAAAYKPVMAMIRTGEARFWAVFQQNGRQAIAVGADVGISLSSEPGVIRWTKIIEIAPGTASGQKSASAQLVGQGDIGTTGEIIVVLGWPEGLPKDAVKVGSIGIATVIGPGSGPIGSLANILLKVKSWAQYL